MEEKRKKEAEMVEVTRQSLELCLPETLALTTETRCRACIIMSYQIFKFPLWKGKLSYRVKRQSVREIWRLAAFRLNE